MHQRKAVPITVALAGIVLIAGATAALATDARAVGRAQQALESAAASAAREITDKVQTEAVLTVEMTCPDGQRSETKKVKVADVTSDLLIGLVDEPCTLASSRANLDVAVPEMESTEIALTGPDFQYGKATVTLTTDGTNVTATVDATARAGIFGRTITARAQSRFSGEGIKQTLTQNLEEATAQAASVIAVRAEARQTAAETAAGPGTEPEAVTESDSPSTSPTPQQTATITPLSIEEVFDMETIRSRFIGEGDGPATYEEAQAEAEKNRQLGW